MKKIALITFSLLIVTPMFTSAQVNVPVASSWDSENHRQFDFWIGEWDVNLRIQQQDGVWEDKVQSTARIYRILDGKAILELWNENKYNEGIKGYSLRYFNEEIDQWELWLNWPGKNRSGSNSLKGSFRHGRGEFFSQFPKNDSVTITQRYTFCDISPNSLRWDDAYSEDGGKTWREGNWIMEFSRKNELAPDLSQNESVHTYDDGNRCDLTSFTFFDDWVGSWSGNIKTLQDGDWVNSDSQVEIYPVLDGCAIMIFMEYEEGGSTTKTFSLNTYNTHANKYEEGLLDNQSKSNFSIRYGDLSDDTITMFDRQGSIKSTWTKKKNSLNWDFYTKVDGQWVHRKSATLKL